MNARERQSIPFEQQPEYLNHPAFQEVFAYIARAQIPWRCLKHHLVIASITVRHEDAAAAPAVYANRVLTHLLRLTVAATEKRTPDEMDRERLVAEWNQLGTPSFDPGGPYDSGGTSICFKSG